MERLKKVIKRYGRWSELTTYTDRIEAHASTDFSHAIENAKALLETIGRAKIETVEAQLPYTDNEPFNDFWDDLYGEFPMGDYSFPASEILFNVDYLAYATETKNFSEDVE